MRAIAKPQEYLLGPVSLSAATQYSIASRRGYQNVGSPPAEIVAVPCASCDLSTPGRLLHSLCVSEYTGLTHVSVSNILFACRLQFFSHYSSVIL